MTLKALIQKDIVQALKQKDEAKLNTLRFLHAQIKDQEIAKDRQELTDQEVAGLINTQLKKLKESLTLFEKGKRDDLVRKTREEIKTLNTYLPQQISDEELEKEVEILIQQNPQMTQPGPLIGLAVKKLGGRADNAKIAQLVQEKLSAATTSF